MGLEILLLYTKQINFGKILYKVKNQNLQTEFSIGYSILTGNGFLWREKGMSRHCVWHTDMSPQVLVKEDCVFLHFKDEKGALRGITGSKPNRKQQGEN